MSTPLHSERFHALDATRAFALMLGVVFHAAWSFVPVPMGAPVGDASASTAFDWFFFTSHTFRMQLFYLIAGFFAHMVCHRRGFGPFLRNRFLRIVVPLIVGWLVLYPLLMALWTTGSNLSGRNLVELPLSTLFTLIYEKRLVLAPQSSGGMFGIWHLWFLYYLVWLYVVVLGFRWILTRSAAIAQRLRAVADRFVAGSMTSPWFLLWLSVGMGLFLWPMGWFGVDTPLGSLAPSIPVLLLYGAFFSFGWLLHRQSSLLKKLGRHWRWQLPLGLALSIPLFAAFQSVRESGITRVAHPRLSTSDLTDWPAFLQRLQSAQDPADAPPELTNLWMHLPPAARARILTLSGEATLYERLGLVRTLEKLLKQPALFGEEPIPPGYKPAPAEAALARTKNRAQLGALFGESLAAPLTQPDWYWSAKLAFSMGYALVMWLLIFGSLGFFQNRFSGHSPAWRYVADGSYWIYLAHLPLMAALQIWMAPWPWPGALKFLLLNAIAFAILFASYHYLVRSTVIGRILNGRAYPFVAWPFRNSPPPVREPAAPQR